MKTIILSLAIFLVAFIFMALGIFVGRKKIKRSCQAVRDLDKQSDPDAKCKTCGN